MKDTPLDTFLSTLLLATPHQKKNERRRRRTVHIVADNARMLRPRSSGHDSFSNSSTHSSSTLSSCATPPMLSPSQQKKKSRWETGSSMVDGASPLSPQSTRKAHRKDIHNNIRNQHPTPSQLSITSSMLAIDERTPLVEAECKRERRFVHLDRKNQPPKHPRLRSRSPMSLSAYRASSVLNTEIVLPLSPSPNSGKASLEQILGEFDSLAVSFLRDHRMG